MSSLAKSINLLYRPPAWHFQPQHPSTATVTPHEDFLCNPSVSFNNTMKQSQLSQRTLWTWDVLNTAFVCWQLSIIIIFPSFLFLLPLNCHWEPWMAIMNGRSAAFKGCRDAIVAQWLHQWHCEAWMVSRRGFNSHPVIKQKPFALFAIMTHSENTSVSVKTERICTK